ncbi:OprD family outer membrane porin [Sulfurimonas sp.]|uniref:OprD family outer membrane porin n=1 Tax=Sulfurimonas sp. TaxID=2022749 RepID=UPI00261C2EB2|nr:OprD family outer membrane porin [Sulfurimonas sp.]MCW8895380.1 OprD family porin [Sulfurimonas sp.]
MRKRLLNSLIITLLMKTVGVNAADDLSSMFSEGKLSGQIREFSIVRTYKKSTSQDDSRSANAVGGYLKYETADFKGLSLGAAFYTTNGFLNDSPKTNYSKVDPTLLGKDNESYSILGEVYLEFKFDNTAFKGGRQKLNTPMASADDARMLPNLFEAYVLSNTDIADTTLVAGHVSKFAQGTFGRVYDGGILSATSGYSPVDSRDQVGGFENIGTYTVGESTDGISLASVTYTGIEGLKLQLWDYYAHDILNAIYAQADYKMDIKSAMAFLSVQFIKENDVGKSLIKNIGGDGKIDSDYWAIKLGAKVQNLSAYVAYSQTSKNDAGDASYANAIVSPWGGMPAFTQGMVTRHQFLAGTKATKLAATYDFKDMGVDFKTTLYYTSYDMDINNGYTFDDASEMGFDIIYHPEIIQNLQVRLRANYADDFHVSAADATTSWDEYRFILNYNF